MNAEKQKVKTVFGLVTALPLKSLGVLEVDSWFICEKDFSGFYGKGTYKVIGHEDDGRVAVDTSYGGRMFFRPEKLVQEFVPDKNPAQCENIGKKYPDFESFYDKIGFKSFDPFSKDHPDLVPDFQDVPPNSIIVTVGTGHFGNLPPMYALLPNGTVYEWESGYQHGGLTPWRFKGWSKWFKKQNEQELY